MGFKQSKLENGEYLPSTPTLKEALKKHQPITVETNFGSEELNEILDPRSPLACRTPINELCKQPHPSIKNVYQQFTPINTKENPMETLRKRIFSGFTYNLNDPRSPTLFLDRTPLVFDNSHEKSLNLDDTFSDLFVETKMPTAPSTDISVMENDTIASSKQTSNDAAHCSVTESLRNNSVILEQNDPRSPTVGVDRTPMIFTDDDEANEEDIIESILATLSLNISTASTTSVITQAEVENAPENKPIERLRKDFGYKKKITKKNVISRRNKIYEDRENFITAKSAITNNTVKESGRTPLSCMKNRSHLRSRSAENSMKLRKCQLQLTSLDDSLNSIKLNS